MLHITEANAREAGGAAERLMRDPYLKEALDEMVFVATQQAIGSLDRNERREARHLVLAIDKLRANLNAVFEQWQSAAKLAQQAKAFE